LPYALSTVIFGIPHCSCVYGDDSSESWRESRTEWNRRKVDSSVNCC